MLICILEIFVYGIQSLNSGGSNTGFDQSALFWRIYKGLYEGYLKSNGAHFDKEFIAHALKQNDGNIFD